MSKGTSVELPERVVIKIQKILGIPPSELEKHGLVELIEDLCDTALMLDQEQHGTVETDSESDSPQQRSCPRPRPGDTHS